MRQPSSPVRRAASSRLGGLAVVLLGALALSGCLAEGATEMAAVARPAGAVPVPTPAPRTAGETVVVAAAEAPAAGDGAGDAALLEAAYAPPADAGSSAGSISGNSAIDALIERHARENNIPLGLAYGVVRVESRYNPRALGSGVYGLSQIKPATARSLGFSGPASALFDPDTNLRYGMRYLAGAWEKGGGDICQAALKYKGGHRATRMTKSTLTYCAAVKREMAKVASRRRMPETLRSAALAVPAAGSVPAQAAPNAALSEISPRPSAFAD